MSKTTTAAVVGALALAVAGGIVALHPVDELQKVRLEGECPAEKPAACEHMRQLPTGDCLCLATQDVPGDAGPTNDLMWVCPDSVVCQPPGAPPSPGCRVIPNSGSVACGVSMRGIDLGNMTAMRAVCSPCDVQPGKWGPCPQCWLDGDCAERCPE